MSSIQKRSISLPSEQAAFIDAKVAAGAYASVSEVVREGLRALEERDEAVQNWLRETVVPRLAALDADPTLGRPLSEVRAQLKARHATRVQSKP